MAGYDVLLLSAGFGTRLRPLTESLPKPLIPLGGKPLIVRHIETLSALGVRRIIINLHYLGDKIRTALKDGSQFGVEIVYSEEDPILDTGGAIKQIEPLLEHDLLLTINSDSVFGTPSPIPALIQAHRAAPERTLFTCLVREESEQQLYGAPLTVDADGEVIKFLGAASKFQRAGESSERMFTGMEVISRAALSLMPSSGTPFSIASGTWVEALNRGYRIHSVEWKGYWNDVGTLERLKQAESDLLSGCYK